jgi:hypothetical protein
MRARGRVACLPGVRWRAPPCPGVHWVRMPRWAWGSRPTASTATRAARRKLESCDTLKPARPRSGVRQASSLVAEGLGGFSGGTLASGVNLMRNESASGGPMGAGLAVERATKAGRGSAACAAFLCRLSPNAHPISPSSFAAAELSALGSDAYYLASQYGCASHNRCTTAA